MTRRIAIIGAGISGLACALHLAKRGFFVEIFEHRSRSEIHAHDFAHSYQTNRSMSMDLSARGIHTLRELGLLDPVRKQAVPMVDKIFHGEDGSLVHIPYGRNESEFILAVSRYHLYQTLLKACEAFENIAIHFEWTFQKLIFNGPIVCFIGKQTGKRYEVEADIVIGADGVNSAVRRCFEEHTSTYFNVTVLRQAYKELSIPKEYGRLLQMNAMHLWSRNQFMLVAQPNRDHSFTCALLLPETGHEISFASIRSRSEVESLFATYFADVKSLLPQLHEEFETHPIGRLRVLQGQTWTCNGNVLLIGDAAHSMTPFFGQGVNCCFEDCTVLSQCLDEAHDQWPIALTLFDQRRVKNGNAISSMSYDNYPELHQSNVFDRVLLKKQIEMALSKKYPSIYTTYHNLVCFHRVPYSYAMACKRLQEPLLDRLSHGINSVAQVNWKRAEEELRIYREQLSSIKETPELSTRV